MYGENDPDDDQRYTVVVNDEEQYSIWSADARIPAGWREAGRTGTQAECLSYIDEVWTDMTPRSARSAPAAGAGAGQGAG